MFYKNTRKQSAYDLQDIKTQTMRQFQKNMQELSCLQKACQTATNIMSQAEILQGRISGTPQKFFFDDFDLTPMLRERLKSLEGRNEEKYSNKRASIENCKEILELSYCNDTVSFASKDDALTYLIHLGYLRYEQSSTQAFVPNEELRLELANAMKSTKWNEFFAFQRQSESLLEATLDMDVNTAADYIEKMHMEYVSTLQYNNENSLSSVITIAYLSAMRYYFKPVRELPTGRGFADFVFIPKPQYKNDYPALVIELKWNKTVQIALDQIKDYVKDNVPAIVETIEKMVSKNGDKINPKDVVKKLSKH